MAGAVAEGGDIKLFKDEDLREINKFLLGKYYKHAKMNWSNIPSLRSKPWAGWPADPADLVRL